MRRAINENPVAQIALIGVLLVLTGLDALDPRPQRLQAGGASERGGRLGLLGDRAGPVRNLHSRTPRPRRPLRPQPRPARPRLPPAPHSDAGGPGARPGLPKEVVVSWARGDAIVLLVVRNGGIDDQLVRRSVRSLSADANIHDLVIRAKNLARYSRVTEAVGLNRVPALVVIRPRSASGDVPEAQVSYGFRSPRASCRRCATRSTRVRKACPTTPARSP